MYQVFECFKLIRRLIEKPKYTKLKVSNKVWLKLLCYINLVGDYEISGFGRIKNNEIIDFKILRQTIGRANAKCDEQAVVEFMKSVPINEISEWELDWHSHVNFNPTPSGTDWGNYELMQEIRLGNQFPVMIVNKHQELTLINYLNKLKSTPIELINTEEEVTEEELTVIYNNCKQDIEELCSLEVVKLPNITGYTNPSAKFFRDRFCINCGIELITKEELETGLCSNCM